MKEIFLKLKEKKEFKLHIETVHHVSENIHAEQPTPRHNLVKLMDF